MYKTLRFRYVLTAQGLLEHSQLRVDDNGLIHAIEAYAGDEFDGDLALPGFVNAHSHCFQRALVGRGEGRQTADSFWSWRDNMYGLAERLNPDSLYIIAQRAFVDMLRAGFTSVAEFHYLHGGAGYDYALRMTEAVIAAAEETGIRLALCPVAYLQGGFGQPLTGAQKLFSPGDSDSYSQLLGELQRRGKLGGVALHSLRALNQEQIKDLLAAVDEMDVLLPLHIHISEQKKEVEEAKALLGATPIRWLDDQVPLTPRWNLVHATHATDSELALIERRGAAITVCPLTEAYLGDGIPNIAAGSACSIAIGSDSNVRISALEELRWLEYTQRLRCQHRAHWDEPGQGLGCSLLSRVGRAGEQVLAQPVGIIDKGYYADLCVINLDRSPLQMLTGQALLDAIITSANNEHIDHVYVAGRQVVQHGAHALAESLIETYSSLLATLVGH